MGYHEAQLDKHLTGIDEQDAKDSAIELLAEQLMSIAEKSAKEILDATSYHISHSDVQKAINECDKFNEAFEEIATALIEVSNKRVF